MAKYKCIVEYEAEQFVDGILLEGMTLDSYGVPGFSWEFDHGPCAIMPITAHHWPVEDGDWVIRNHDTNNPCPVHRTIKPDVFAATYEKVGQ